jgi:hypothetical protein
VDKEPKVHKEVRVLKVLKEAAEDKVRKELKEL